jgi:hypothetical protein
MREQLMATKDQSRGSTIDHVAVLHGEETVPKVKQGRADGVPPFLPAQVA